MNLQNLNVEIVKRPGLDLATLTSITTFEKELSPNTSKASELWEDLFHNEELSQIDIASENNIYLVYHQYQKNHKSELRLSLGIPLKESPPRLPSGFTHLALPKGTYAKVKSTIGPLPDIIQETWKTIALINFLQLGYARTFQYDFEVYPLNLKDQEHTKIDIYLSVKSHL